MMTEELFNDLKVSGLFQEIEWFGVDQLGQIGAFISGGNAYFPNEIWGSYETYGNTLNFFIGRLKEKSYKEILESTGEANFIDFAESGLFAYDYDPNSEQIYKLMKRPSKPITIENLELDRYLIDSLPRLNVVFGGSQINCEKLV